MKPLITAEHRAELLAYIAENATDSQLLDMADEIYHTREHAETALKKFRASLPKKETAPSVELAPTGAVRLLPKQAADQPIKQETLTSAMASVDTVKEPPGVAAKRVTKSTQKAIELFLKKGPASSSVVNQAINGRPGNTVAVLKLLWSRKVVAWNATTGFYSLT